MLEQTLAELSQGAEDLDPILHSFKNAQHLRVGVRDVLGKDDVRSTHAALADVAEACLKQIAASEYAKLVEKFGEPTILIPSESEPPTAGAVQQWQRFADREGDACEPVVLALGKLGGREPNYHSDLDLIFLYEAGGNTLGRQRGSHGSTTNGHFFSELGQRVIRMMSHLGPHGRLYEVDARLRPTGKSGLLAVPIDAFARYFSEGRGQLWERQALCKARVVLGAPAAAEYAMQAVADAAFGPAWTPAVRHRNSRRCGCGSKRTRRSAISSAVPAARSTSSSSCRCCSSSTAAPIASIRRPGTRRGARSARSGRLPLERRCRLFPPQLPLPAQRRGPHPPDERRRPARVAGEPQGTGEARVSCSATPTRASWSREAEHMFAENRVRFNRIFDAAERD